MPGFDPRVLAGLERQLDERRLALETGERIGWKIGFNVPAAQERLGIERSVIGTLTADRVLAPGGSFPTAGATAVHAEVEVAIVIGAPVAGDADAQAGRAAIAGYGAAIEIVDFDSPIDDVERIVAANVFHRAVVFGDDKVAELPSSSAAVSIDGAERGRVADLATAVGDPAAIVLLVAEALAACDERLEDGDRIIAGALVPPLAVDAGERLLFDAGALGRVEVAFD